MCKSGGGVVHATKVSALIRHLLRHSQVPLPEAQIARCLYLMDVEWVRATGEALTGLGWSFHCRQPWSAEIGVILKGMVEESDTRILREVGGQGRAAIVFQPQGRRRASSLTPVEAMVANYALEVSRLPLRVLLHGEGPDLQSTSRAEHDLSFVADGYWGAES